MSIRCKFKCFNADVNEHREMIHLHAVYSDNPEDENRKWSLATPSGHMSVCITNPEAFGAFEIGKEYYLDIKPV